MVGRQSTPIVTTVAPTMPVLAASSVPTITTENARPPRIPPNSSPSVSRRSSAIFVRSSTSPMNTNSGTATSVSLFIVPKIRLGRASR